ncbi:exonuclease [Clostridium neonatale]|uniref:Exonuclease n=1 Tax=Clostridium neonatale TaxID=137838 RepID=A0A2A7MEF9_9CLOT|nr:3'-5' exonuclease [Clostridium neonatale]PEG25112.1 exonuclease [Clostridium neonatale]PEG30242.1 exonuclease [Clostridium neonatale]CAH0436102.1 Putative ribonuclease, H-like domain [Clostridium neonatale]
MNYIIYDLEFNQPLSKDNNISDLTFEIIQIGALKLNENLEVISTFNRLVKPTAYLEIHPYIENLTQISTDMVMSHAQFPHIYNEFIDFIGNDEFVMCVWGAGDIKELIKNINFHKLKTLDNFKKYIDVQKLMSKYIKTPKGTKIGLGSAVEFFNISVTKEFHDAFNDAYYTAEVFKKLYNPEIKFSIYENKPSKRVDLPKRKLDTLRLFAQIEKMYDRSLSDEEKSLIKLAYNMGRTHQFLR